MKDQHDKTELEVVDKKTNKPYSKRIIITIGILLLIGLIIMAAASSSTKKTGALQKTEAPKYEPAQANQALDLDKKTQEPLPGKILEKYDNTPNGNVDQTAGLRLEGENNSSNPTFSSSNMDAPQLLQDQEQRKQQQTQLEQDRQNQIKQAKQQWLELQKASFISQPQIAGNWKDGKIQQQKDSPTGELMGAVENNNKSEIRNPYLEVYEKYLKEKPTSSASAAPQQNQSDKEQFFNSTNSGRGMLKSTVQPMISPYMIPSGALIPCALISGVNSDLPGNIVAQVTENVCDWRNPDRILIPYGTKVFGIYDAKIAFAQRRLQLSWQKLIFPDGKTLDLSGMPGVTKQGYSGLTDKYYPRYGRLFTAAVMTAALSSVGLLFDNNSNNNQTIVTTSTGVVVIPGNNDTSNEFAKAVAESIGGAGTKLFDKFLNAAPTVLIRPAKRFNIMVNADIPFWAAYGKL